MSQYKLYIDNKLEFEGTKEEVIKHSKVSEKTAKTWLNNLNRAKINDIKKFLSKAFTLQNEIDAYEEQIEKLKSLAENIGEMADGEIYGKGKVSDVVGNNVAKVVDLQYKYIDRVATLLIVKDDIQNMIDTLDCGTQKAVLTERYINLKTWEEVCKAVNYSWKHTHRFHGEALKILAQQKMT